LCSYLHRVFVVGHIVTTYLGECCDSSWILLVLLCLMIFDLDRCIFYLRYRTFLIFFFFSSRRRHTRFKCDWSSDVCSSDLTAAAMAGLVRISVSSVQRIWRSHGLQPHRVRQFKLSRDPEFIPKLRDIVGLYIDPPAHAMVLSVDEKSQIQALDRTQPGLPIKPGRCGTMTHDYKRNGTTTLFAALDVLDGKVIGRCMQRHRHQEFIRFLNAIEVEVPVGKIIHVILDNYGPHKHPKTRAWLSRHPRFVFHYTPTSASWLNAVEGFFAKLTKRRLKRGVFCSIVDLQAAIDRFLRETKDDPKPFVWTADPEKIIASVKRGDQALESIH